MYQAILISTLLFGQATETRLGGIEKAIITARAETLSEKYDSYPAETKRRLMLSGLADELRRLEGFTPPIKVDEENFIKNEVDKYILDVRSDEGQILPSPQSGWFDITYNGRDMKVWGTKRQDGNIEWYPEDQVVQEPIKSWHDSEINGVPVKVWGYKSGPGRLRISPLEQTPEVQTLLGVNTQPIPVATAPVIPQAIYNPQPSLPISPAYSNFSSGMSTSNCVGGT